MEIKRKVHGDKINVTNIISWVAFIIIQVKCDYSDSDQITEKIVDMLRSLIDSELKTCNVV